MASELYVGRVRSVVVLVLLSLVTLGIYFFIWLAVVNGELRRHLNGGPSPAGRWFLFLLVPVIGWFIVFYLMARNVRTIQLSASQESLIVPIYHAFWGIVPVLGWFIAMGFVQRGLNRAWIKVNNLFGEGAGTQSRVECPDCENQFLSLFNPLLPRPVVCPACGRAGDV